MSTIRHGLSQAIPRSRPPPPLSNYSTTGVENSAWASQDFMLGVGMVILQPSTDKIVVIYEKEKRYWFFPRGRKDVGESLEQAALREAYEESGYRARFLPLCTPHHQPIAPHVRGQSLNTEAIFVSMNSWAPKKDFRGQIIDNGGEYLTHWYVGEIGPDAIRESGTGMPDEQNYESHLLTFEEAYTKVWGQETKVLVYAWNVYLQTKRFFPVDEGEEYDKDAPSGTEADPDARV